MRISRIKREDIGPITKAIGQKRKRGEIPEV